MERTKLGLSKDKMYKALGDGERTSKKVSMIRKSDGSTFKRKNANQYGTAEGGNDYTEKRSNRTDRFDLGGTADSSNTGANMGGTMGSSVMKHGGSVNGTYLNTISSDKKSKILNNIAKQYGISIKNAEEEVKDADAEMLYEYIANDQHLRMDIYNDFKKNKHANGGGLSDLPENPNNDAISYKTGGGANGYKLTLKNWDADVYEDDYNEGEGNQVNSFSEKVNKSFASGEELLKYISNNVLYHDVKKEYYSIMEDDGRIVTSVLVNEDNLAASENEIEKWKKGDKKLYSASYNFYITLTQEKTPSADELSKLLGISVYKKGGKLSRYANGGSTKGFEYTIGGL